MTPIQITNQIIEMVQNKPYIKIDLKIIEPILDLVLDYLINRGYGVQLIDDTTYKIYNLLK